MKKSRVTIWEEKIEWCNPILNQIIQPYLEDLTFPIEVSSESWEETMEILNRFYSNARKNIDNDITMFQNFILSPSKNLFIVEGEVGIGKTWFIRKKLYDSVISDDGFKYDTGVIDLMYTQINQVEETIYEQLGPILDKYTEHIFGSSEITLKKYAEFKYLIKKGIKKTTENNIMIASSVKSKVESWFKLDSINYSKLMLKAIEYLNGPRLIIALDNIDNISEKDHETILRIVQRTLRNKVIKIIVPLRKTSVLLKNRFGGLNEVVFDQMKLSPITIKPMIKIRLNRSYDDIDLSVYPIIKDNNKEFTYSRLFKRLYSGETGKLLVNIIGGNCRIALNFTRRILHSSHLKGLHNIHLTEYIVASLMLSNDFEFDEGAPIINLFDNQERGKKGNALIRFRILEYFYNQERGNPIHKDFKTYFLRLGYDSYRIRKVLVRFLMTYIITSDNNLKPKKLQNIEEREIGDLIITDFGKSYFDILLTKMWYYVSIKRGMLKSFPKHLLSYDKENKWYYITHTQFSRFLNTHEESERSRIKRYEKDSGNIRKNVYLKPPSIMFKNVFSKEDKNGKYY